MGLIIKSLHFVGHGVDVVQNFAIHAPFQAIGNVDFVEFSLDNGFFVVLRMLPAKVERSLLPFETGGIPRVGLVSHGTYKNIYVLGKICFRAPLYLTCPQPSLGIHFAVVESIVSLAPVYFS